MPADNVPDGKIVIRAVTSVKARVWGALREEGASGSGGGTRMAPYLPPSSAGIWSAMLGTLSLTDWCVWKSFMASSLRFRRIKAVKL